jgi:hypothetical protein
VLHIHHSLKPTPQHFATAVFRMSSSTWPTLLISGTVRKDLLTEEEAVEIVSCLSTETSHHKRRLAALRVVLWWIKCCGIFWLRWRVMWNNSRSINSAKQTILSMHPGHKISEYHIVKKKCLNEVKWTYLVHLSTCINKKFCKLDMLYEDLKL